MTQLDEDIVAKLIETGHRLMEKFVKPPKGWIPWILPTSIFIREYLRIKEAYPFEIYRALREARRRLSEMTGKRYPLHVGAPVNFYKYIWVLEKLGLIKRTGRVEPAERIGGTPLPSRFWRRYYRLVPELIEDVRWLNPQRAIARERGWKVAKEEII